jgi:hypothetical protein
MLTRLAAVVQDVGVIASGVLKCVGKNRHLVEHTLSVDVLGKLHDGGREPRGFNGDGTEGIANNISDNRSNPGPQLALMIATFFKHLDEVTRFIRCPPWPRD